MLTRRRFVAASAAAGAWSATPRPARSQAPGKLARLVVGFAPGGSSDVTARLLVDQMKGYAATIIIDNRPGAGGRIAVEAVKAGAPDGSIMLLSPASMIVLYPHLYKPLGYDPVQDFAAVTTVCAFPFVLSVGPLVPREVRTLAHFIGWCKANPKLASYGTSGAGSMLHFAGMMLARAANFDFTHVPYKGASPALQDLLGGQVASTVGVLGIALPHIQSGNLRALAMTGATRSSFLPNVPTLTEAGYPGLEITEWQGLFVPAQDAAGDRPGAQSIGARCARHRRGQSRIGQAVIRGRGHEPGGIRGTRESGHRALGADCEGIRVHPGELARVPSPRRRLPMRGGIFHDGTPAPGARTNTRLRIRLDHVGHVFELGRELHQRFACVEIRTFVREPEAIACPLMKHLRIHVVAPWSLR